MRERNRGIVVRSAVLVLAVTLAAVAGNAQPTPVALEVITPGGLTLEPQVEWERARLVVGGPEDYRIEQTFTSPEEILFHALDASGNPLADGFYRYELRLVRAKAAMARTSLHSGRFRLVGGALQAVLLEGDESHDVSTRTDPEVDEDGVEDYFPDDVGSGDEICVGCTSGFEPGSSSFGSEKLMIIDTTPGMAFLRSESATDLEAWGWELGVAPVIGLFYISDLNSAGQSTKTPFVIEDDTPSDTLYLATTGRVGIGTGIPAATLHVMGGPLRVERTGSVTASQQFKTSSQTWQFQNNGTTGTFSIRDLTNTNSPVRIFPGGLGSTLVVRNGRLGLRNTIPQHPIHAFNGARLTSGGTWANGSSRESKQDIESLSAAEALATLEGLDPVKFAYKVDASDRHVGFIAEDVPELVATPDRKALAAMDVVAVLTKVVQEHEPNTTR